MLPQSQYGGHAPGALSLAHGRAHPPSTPTSPQQQPVMAAMSLLIRRWRGLSRLAATTPPSDVFFLFWRALAQVNFCIPQDAYVHDHVGHPLWPVDWSDLVYFREPDAATAQVHSAGREGHPPKDSLSDD